MESCPIFLKRIIEECFWQISNKISEEKHLKLSNRLFLARKRFSFSANVWFIADNFCGKGCLVWILGCVDEYLWIFSDIFQCVPVTRILHQFYFPPRPLLTSPSPQPCHERGKRSRTGRWIFSWKMCPNFFLFPHPFIIVIIFLWVY